MEHQDADTSAESIAKTIADYREGEIEPPTAEHVKKWAKCFEKGVRADLLGELDHVLKQTYLSKKDVEKFLKTLTKSGKLAGADPKKFWGAANFLSIQSGGISQREMLDLLQQVLDKQLGLTLEKCGSEKGPFIYIDDAIFSGNRVVNDCRDWIPNDAPDEIELHVVVAASHTAADFYIGKQLATIAEQAKKRIKLQIWRLITFHNKSNEGAESDVLRLRKFPADAASNAFAEEFCEDNPPALLRPENQQSSSKIFSSEKSRDLLEREFWNAGLAVREACPQLKGTHRPLGYTSSGSANKLGFGSLLVTYRNCPNNCPLALWAGDPWYALVPRKTN